MHRALISVSDKTGLPELARALVQAGYQLISTGGTAQLLQKEGIAVTQVAEVTGFPEILDGRVKTLNPRIHGGILARHTPEHTQQLQEHDIDFIDMVVVNLYPFRATVAKARVSLEEAIENIDIGGPAMIRAAAKNYQAVTVVVRPEDYGVIINKLEQGTEISEAERLALATKAFQHTAAYDGVIADYLRRLSGGGWPEEISWAGEKVYELRYGENPHQKAAFYRNMAAGKGLADAEKLNGKELSYNNLMDTESAWNLVKEFSVPACVVLKHNNPCGVAVADNLAEAFRQALAADSKSAFGGIIALNRPVDMATAQQIIVPFMEVVIAPDYEAEALACLRTKKQLRILKFTPQPVDPYTVRTISGGFLVQENDVRSLSEADLRVVTDQQPSESEMADMQIAWKIVKHVKSNAIVVVKNGVTVGIGAGQMNRVGAAELALADADKTQGAVLASDAFLPFRDTVDLAAAKGIRAIIQTGGSIRDEESIAACNEHGLSMVFTDIRHFRH